MALALSGTSNGSLNNLSLSGNTATVVDTARAGGIIQVQSVEVSTDFSTTSVSPVDVTNYTLSITPSSSSNKILCMVSTCVRITGGTTTNVRALLRLLRGSTDIAQAFVGVSIDSASSRNAYDSTEIIFLDSPATTSSTTYKIDIKSSNSTYTSSVLATDTPTLTLMEIVA